MSLFRVGAEAPPQGGNSLTPDETLPLAPVSVNHSVDDGRRKVAPSSGADLRHRPPPPGSAQALLGLGQLASRSGGVVLRLDQVGKARRAARGRGLSRRVAASQQERCHPACSPRTSALGHHQRRAGLIPAREPRGAGARAGKALILGRRRGEAAPHTYLARFLRGAQPCAPRPGSRRSTRGARQERLDGLVPDPRHDGIAGVVGV